ncbi:hypothetical protein CYMTET_44336 [Cymbomonas tetramitiformis]|uniref:Uncharacterized protein n=1 Tax=Cymbomonas tetramitiformis TaxID=36881 RepID=A0AAE0F0S7_9CHLO|nr:hypothetical protein CYMTET_44336 [Cymbomonas tetramitiformis]
MGWSGDTLLEMSDGKGIRAHNLKAGDRLRSDTGDAVRVECVVVTNIEQGAGGEGLCTLNFQENVRPDVNLDDFAASTRPLARGHHWNPIFVPGRLRKGSMNWRFIRDVALCEVGVKKDAFAYDIVLNSVDRRRLVSVFGGIFIPGLGHNIGDPLIAHPYFGTELVINDLKRDPAYAQSGRVVLLEKNYVRSQDAMRTVQRIVVSAGEDSEMCTVA